MQREDPNNPGVVHPTSPDNFIDGGGVRDYLEGIVNWANNVTLNPINPPLYGGGPIPLPPNFVTDAKIFYVFDKNTDVHFTADNVGLTNNDNNCGPYCIDNFPINDDCELNIFIIRELDDNGNLDETPGGCGPGYLGENRNCVLMKNLFSDFTNNPPGSSTGGTTGGNSPATGPLLVHEISHSLGLLHTVNSTNLFPDISSPEFTGDICNPNIDANCTNNVMTRYFSTVQNYLSPLQLAQMHRLLIGSWRAKQLKVEYDQTRSIIVNADETWDIGRVIYGDVIINAGNTLTITCKVIMPPTGKIIVRPGARLHIDGGLITNTSHKCGYFWEGIRVEGNPDLPQTAQNQGVVELSNDAIIEYARVGIQVGYAKKNLLGQKTGGIVLASGEVDRTALFRNNATAVWFYPYENINAVTGLEENNLSEFKKCEFLVNDDYLAFGFIRQFRMDKVRGIEIRACDFKNELFIENSPNGKGGTAIESMDAGYKVSILCESSTVPCPDADIIPSTFTGFSHGIKAANISTINTYSVFHAEFEKNGIGILNNGVNNPRIVKNDFRVGGQVDPNNTNVTFGIIVNTSTGFTIEENNFIGISGSDQNGAIRIFDSGEDGNRVYKNFFAGSFTAANIATGLNRSTSSIGLSGLEYLCNDNENGSGNIFDFAVVNEGINIYQGDQNTPAGNTFSLNGNNPASDFFNFQQAADLVTYFYHDVSGNTNFELPEDRFNVVTSILTFPNGCLSSPDINDDFWSNDDKIYYSNIFNSKYQDVQQKMNVYQPDAVNQADLAAEIGLLNTQLDNAANRQIHFEMEQDIANDLSGIRQLWASSTNLERQYLVAESYFQEGNINTGNQILGTIPTQFGLGNDALATHNKYANLSSLQQTILSNNREFDNLTNSELGTIANLSKDDLNRVTIKAQSWLDFYYEESFDDLFVFPVAPNQNSYQASIPNEIISSKTISFNATPNPASDEVTFHFSLPKEMKKGKILIQDINGKIIHEINLTQDSKNANWNPSNIQRGIYFYSLIIDDKTLETKKLVLIK
jgi:hypothetical protein